MAVGTVSKALLTEIANAIREQNGQQVRYMPLEMSSQVLEMDGTREGVGLVAAPEAGTGILSEVVFELLADAIRTQNGSTATYTPAEMPAAIRALTWDTGVKMRALLLSDGTLELNYRDGRSSDVEGAVILEGWEIPAEGFSSSNDIPWRTRRSEVLRVLIDSDFASGGLTNASHLFQSLQQMTEVRGFEALEGALSFDQVFSSCPSLESVYATGWEPTGEQTGNLGLYGCNRLVGGMGYSPDYGEDVDGHLGFGEDGILTDPAADAREWMTCHLYADGELVLTLDPEPEEGREVALTSRMCATARYRAIGSRAWDDAGVDVLKATFSEDLSGLTYANLSYWFYTDGEMTEVAGLSNLPEVREMRYAFSSCDGLTELDLSGFPTEGLTDLFYCFSGCSNLATIWVDADWSLPAGCEGSGMFYGCEALVGGAGTTYDSGGRDEGYCRIDDPPVAPGYLTARG